MGNVQSVCNKSMTRRLPLILLLVCVSLSAAIMSTAVQARAQEKYTAFVSVLPQKFFVNNVAGDRAVVKVLVGPGQSPATFEPTAKQLAELADAKIYFRIGLPFENIWMQRIKAINPVMTVVDMRTDIPLRDLENSEPKSTQATNKVHRHGEGRLDPHIWTDPVLANTMINTIRLSLNNIDPGGSIQYEKNFLRLQTELQLSLIHI